MAESFSIGLGQTQLNDPAAPQLGRRGANGGGMVRSAPQIYMPDVVQDPTAAALLKIGQAVFEPMVKEQQAKQFLIGAQRVAQGEALKDIIDEQPWYSKIFGESASIQGARTVAQITQVDKYTASLYGDMGRLQQMGREEVGEEVNGKMLEFLTGDASTDAVIQQKMVESAGPFYNAHAKANYKWTQDTMQQQVSGMIMSSANTLQAAAKQRLEGTMTDDDWARQQVNAASVMQPIAGQSPESYWAAVEESTIDAMANGNHHFAGMVFSSGLYDHAPAEVRKRLLDARSTYEARTVEKEGFLEYGAAIGELQGRARAGTLSSAGIADAVVAINEDFRMRTGIEGDIVNRKTFGSMLAGNYSAMYKRAERNARDANKEALKQGETVARLSEIHQALLVGGGNLITAAGHKKTETDTIFFGMWEQSAAAGKNPAGMAIQNFNEGAGYVNPMVANKMQASLRAAKGEGYSGKAFDAAYQQFRAIADEPGGQAAAMAYLGDEDGPKMMEYDALLKANIAPEFAYPMAFEKPLDRSRKSTDKDVWKKVQETVADQQPGWWAEKFGAAPLNPAGQRIVANVLGQSYDTLASGGAMSDDAAFKVGMDVARQKLDIVGPFAFAKRAGQQPVSALIGTDDATTGKFLNEYLRDESSKQGVKMELAKSLGSNARFATDLGWGAGWLPGAVSDAFSHFTRDQPDVTIMRGVDRTDPETGLQYTSLSVMVMGQDGNSAQMQIDTRELRKQFEKSGYFK